MPRTERPVILITCDVMDRGQPTETLLRLRLNYVDAVAAAGGLPLLLAPEPATMLDALDLCDGVLLSGSDAGVLVSPLRDRFETQMVGQALDRGLPILGICHGMQVLGQVLGGVVTRDDPALLAPCSRHLPRPVPDLAAHTVTFAPDSQIVSIAAQDSANVNSLHRHALRGTGRFRVTATAPDGVTEAIESTATPFCMGVQWHPEYQLTQVDTRLMRAFVLAAALGHNQR